MQRATSRDCSDACWALGLHASVHVPAHDDLARERLCRYLARPAFSLARFGVRRDGLVVYRVKNAGRGRVKPRVISLECLARLAAMVPPPRYPLLRLHGVLAPRHKWRARVVPRPPESYAECTKLSAKRKNATAAAEPRAEAAGVSRIQRGEPTARRGEAEPALLQTAEVVQTSTLLVTGAASRVAPNILSIAHWDRLLGGQLYAPHSRLDWATLLRRTFDVDVKRCTGCASRMTVRAVVTDGASIARLLGALRRSRDPPVAA